MADGPPSWIQSVSFQMSDGGCKSVDLKERKKDLLPGLHALLSQSTINTHQFACDHQQLMVQLAFMCRQVHCSCNKNLSSGLYLSRKEADSTT